MGKIIAAKGIVSWVSMVTLFKSCQLAKESVWHKLKIYVGID